MSNPRSKIESLEPRRLLSVTLDASYGTASPEGVGVLDWEAADAETTVDVDLLSDGGTLLALSTTNGGPTLIRLDAAGQRVSSFGDDGLLRLDDPGLGFIAEVVPDSDGTFDVLVDGPGVSSVYFTLDASGNEVANSRITVSELGPFDMAALPGGDRVVVTDREILRLNGDGSFDTSFGGGDGIIEFEPPSGANNFTFFRPQAVEVDSSGRIVVVGHEAQVTTGNDQGQVRRYTATGSLDASFGSSGIAEPTLNPNESFVRSVVIDDNGLIIVAGYEQPNPADSERELFVAALDSSGNDALVFGGTSRFAVADYVPPTFGAFAPFVRVQEASGGDVVVSYVASRADVPTASFRVDYQSGFTVTPFDPVPAGQQTTVIPFVETGSDGSSVVATSAAPGLSLVADVVVTRTLPNGNLDTAFGNGGTVIEGTFASIDQTTFGSDVDDEERALFAGGLFNSLDLPFGVGRLDANGLPDASFGTDGIATSGAGISQDVVAEPGGSLVVVGRRFEVDLSLGQLFDFGQAVRFAEDGTVMEVFDAESSAAFQNLLPNGVVQVLFTDAARDDAGNVFVRGTAFDESFTRREFVAKLSTNLTLDPTFGTDGIAILPGATNVGVTGSNITVTPGGKVVVAHAIFGGDAVVRQLNADGSADSSFGTGGVLTIEDITRQVGGVKAGVDGSLFLSVTNSDSNGRFGSVLKLADDGSAAAGWTIERIDLGSSSDDLLDLVVASDGSVTTVGEITIGGQFDAVVARLDANGLLDDTFGDDGIDTFDLGSDGDVATGVDIDPTGGLIVTGATDREATRGDFAAIRLATPTLLGDANGDGVVNLADFGILRAEFGQTGGSLFADFNNDGVVNLADFGILRANFGATL